MLTLIVIAATIYGIGLRADRIHAQRTVKEPTVDIAALRANVPGIASRVGSLTVFHAQRAVTEPKMIGSEPTRTGADVSRASVDKSNASGSVTSPRGLYMRHSAGYWHWRYTLAARKVRDTRAKLRQRLHPTVDYAYRLASAVTGVSYWQLRSVGWCESRHYPFAENGRYKGVMQLGWAPFGMSPFDPIANVLSAAMTVKHDGSWRQWSCLP